MNVFLSLAHQLQFQRGESYYNLLLILSFSILRSHTLAKANSIKEILEIEEKIRALEEDIESATGRLKYLSDQVDYSTLDLTISTQKNFKYSPEKRDKFLERLKQSLSKGWFGLVDFFLILIHIWPIWIIGVLIFYAWRKYKMRSRRK